MTSRQSTAIPVPTVQRPPSHCVTAQVQDQSPQPPPWETVQQRPNVDRSRPQAHPAAQAVVQVRTCRMGTVRQASGEIVRGNRSPVVAVEVQAAAAALVVVVVAAAGLGLPWDRAVLPLVDRPFRRLLRTWQVVEGRPLADDRPEVSLRLPQPAHVAHNVSDAAGWIDRG